MHGISLEFLADKPKFADIADEFLEFINGAELIIHNAPFDIGFLNAELDRLGRVPVGTICNGVIDTLRMAKELHPGKRNSLDALCERYEIDNSSRTLHGALLDTELLADVFLAMTRGQNSLMIEPDAAPRPNIGADGLVRERKPLNVRRALPEEIAEHETSAGGDRQGIERRLHLATQARNRSGLISPCCPFPCSSGSLWKSSGYLYIGRHFMHLDWPLAIVGAINCLLGLRFWMNATTWTFGMAFASPAPRLGFFQAAGDHGRRIPRLPAHLPARHPFRAAVDAG